MSDENEGVGSLVSKNVVALNTLTENIIKDEGGGSLVSSNVVALNT